MNDVELRDRLFQLFPPETDGDWGDVVRRAGRPRRRFRRILLPVVVLLVAVLAVGSALALSGRLGGLLHGTPVKDLTPNERFILSERLNANGRVELIATHGSRAFYVIRKGDGAVCYAVGAQRKNLTPAQAELRTRFQAMGCLGKGVFPSRALPVLDFSYYQLRRGERLPGTLVGLEGFAADPVRTIGVIGPDDKIAYTTPVDRNVYSARSARVAGARGIVALDDDGKPLWVQCQARGGCGTYKSSPPPVLPPSGRPVPRRLPPVRTPVQRGSADNVSIVVRGTLVEANLGGISPQLERLLTAKRHEIGIACFKLVRFAGRRFSKGVGVSAPFATVVRAELAGSPFERPFTAPFDGCTITGTYGHTWNDAHGTHDAVEIALTAAGRRYFAERAVARDIAWLARARVFHDIRYARQQLSAVEVTPRLAPRVVPMSAPSQTPPVGRLGLWIGPNRRIVLAERASTGRRFYLELRHGVIYRTNLGDLTGVI
jgi:hypothetical protein